MIKNRIWLMADFHFSHSKIIEYCYRPKDYEEKLKHSLFSIPKEDSLLFLGDICMGEDEYVHEKYIIPLKCKKFLIKGNHDSKSNSWYLGHGWDFVAYAIKDIYYGVKVLFSHTPQVWDGWYDLNIHGHLHNLSYRKDEYESNFMQYLVSSEKTNYKSILLESLIKKLKK